MTDTRSLIAASALLMLGAYPAAAQESSDDMSFFVTSENPGSGGDLGGLSGADEHCQSLADEAGAGDKTWRAYLSTSEEDARDRIGDGPWYNAAGEMIAESVEDLHSGDNNLTAETALDEQGDSPNYIGGPQPLEHDVLTGTGDDGTASDMTCNDWTSDSADSSAMLGHADRMGREEGVNSWNAVHASQGCGMEQLEATGGAGLYYCFATD